VRVGPNCVSDVDMTCGRRHAAVRSAEPCRKDVDLFKGAAAHWEAVAKRYDSTRLITGETKFLNTVAISAQDRSLLEVFEDSLPPSGRWHVATGGADRNPWNIGRTPSPRRGEGILCPLWGSGGSILVHGFRCATPVATVQRPAGAQAKAVSGRIPGPGAGLFLILYIPVDPGLIPFGRNRL
jgi:hypothetical protein